MVLFCLVLVDLIYTSFELNQWLWFCGLYIVHFVSRKLEPTFQIKLSN